MTIDEIKQTEAGYLVSSSKIYRQYGKVLK